MLRSLCGSLLVLILAACATAPNSTAPAKAATEEKPPASTTTAEKPADKTEPKPSYSVLHRVLCYIPNRAMDIVDIVRLRARVGPGVAVGARATKVADVFVGTYASVFAGLPGPRLRRAPRLPAGMESLSGVGVSLADATTGGGVGPNYSPTEFGLGLQALIVGFDLGADPMEVLDFATGLIFIDLRDDDF